MLNSISVIATLREVDKEDKTIRYVTIDRPYALLKDRLISDRFACLNWNKIDKGELFTFKENSLVAIKGRLENYRNLSVIVVESIVYLGLTN